MESTSNDIALAERLGRKRARVMPIFAVLFILQQGSFYGASRAEHVTRAVERVDLAAWIVLSAVLIGVLWTGGMWFRGRRVRALLNDETTRANRADALSLGFLAAMIAGLILYAVGDAMQIGTREAIHLIVSAGLVSAMLRFGFLERRGFD